MTITDDGDRMPDGGGDGGGAFATDGRLPETDTDDTAGRSDGAQLLVGKISGIVARATDTGVGNERWILRDRKHVLDGLR